ncbi:MAG: cation:proton antiporter [Bacteroidia bacterium]
MSKTTELYLDKFWEVPSTSSQRHPVCTHWHGNAGSDLRTGLHYRRFVGAIPIILDLSVFIPVAPPIKAFEKRLDFVPKTNLIMTWGGLRGGISIALALSLSEEMNREMFLVLAYIVVVFSILVQGLSIERVIRRFLPGG